MANPHILVVENNQADADWIRDELHPWKIDVVETMAECEEALTDAHEAVILDLGLPDSAGIETVRSTLALTSKPVIVYSVNGRDETVAEALALGCADYVVKGGIEPFAVRRMVKHALYRQQHLETYEDRRKQLSERLDAVDGEDSNVQLAPELTGPLAALGADGQILGATSRAKAILDTLPSETLAKAMAAVDLRLNSASQVRHTLSADWLGLFVRHPDNLDTMLCLFVPNRNDADVGASLHQQALHHFRTPLTPLMLDLAVMRSGGASGHDERIERIERNARRIRRFAEQYVDAVSLLEGNLQLHSEIVDLTSAIRRVDSRAKVRAAMKVVGDPQRIEDLLLLMQAHVGTDATIVGEKEGDQYVVRMTSRSWDGPAVEEMFTPFQHTIAGMDPGGIGLVTGQLVCNQMGGRLAGETVDTGVCLSMSLPVHEQPKAP